MGRVRTKRGSYCDIGNIEHSVTTNCYYNLEINAHAMIIYVVSGRDDNIPFEISCLQSQACESFFRQARSFTSTESTVVNFTMQSFESRLNKIEAKEEIMYKRKEELIFPRLSNTSSQVETYFPTDDEIVSIIESSRYAAYQKLLNLGIRESKIIFNESIHLRKPKEKPHSSCGHFEFVRVPTMENDEHEETVYNRYEICPEAGTEFIVKDSCNVKPNNIFKIRNRNGKVVHLKKSTFVWMISNQTERCSTDRIYRFQSSQEKASLSIQRIGNDVLNNIVIGEWILVREDSFKVCKVYGFKYMTGKNKNYSLDSAPINVPTGAKRRGIIILGSYFDIFYFDTEFLLEISDQSSKIQIDIDRYITHLEKPSIFNSLLVYDCNSAKYINKFVSNKK
ncbi:uncharacterized protein LOC131434356 [Malaya genurostris]|uniref:uncharacterized protein LOC131434356 n=1 Tax=Malaya genurostris TaxID=325434 RepID=UPI0026F39247|nr:uncharacterized protein LOC131434356 [Malaya genurostris]